MTRKEEIRQEARGRLQAIGSGERTTIGRQVGERVWRIPEIAGARTILLYASLPEEVPTNEIAAEAWRRGIDVVYPRCLVDEIAMSLHLVRTEADLVPDGRYGLREPGGHCPLTEIGLIDVALIPGLAWDRAGNRLGRGAGYYDRLLAHSNWRALRCGLYFAVQEFPALPTEPWDAPLDRIVTEKEVLSFEF